MRLEATIERNRIPEGCVPLPGDYKLASTGQTVVVYRRPEPSPEMVRVQAELERTNEECEVLSRSLGFAARATWLLTKPVGLEMWRRRDGWCKS